MPPKTRRAPSPLPSTSASASEAQAQAQAQADVAAEIDYPEARRRIRSARPPAGTPLRHAVIHAAQAYSPQSLTDVVAIIGESTANSKRRRVDYHMKNHVRRNRYLAYLDDKWGVDAWVPPLARDAGVGLTRQGLNQKDISYLRTLTEHAIADGKPLMSLFAEGGAVYEATSAPKDGGDGLRIWNASTAKTALSLYNTARLLSPVEEARGSPEPPASHASPASLGDGVGYLSDESLASGSPAKQQQDDLIPASPSVQTPERGREALPDHDLFDDQESLFGDVGPMHDLEQGEEHDGFLERDRRDLRDPFEVHGRSGSFLFHRATTKNREDEEEGTLVLNRHSSRARQCKRKFEDITARTEPEPKPRGFVESPHRAAADDTEDEAGHVSISSPIADDSPVDEQLRDPEQHIPQSSSRSAFSQEARQRTIDLLKDPEACLTDEAVHVLQSEILGDFAQDQVKALDPLHVEIDGQIPDYKPRLWSKRDHPPRSIVFFLHHTHPAHWTLTVIEVPGCRIYWYDPLPCERRTAKTSTRLRALVRSSFPDLSNFSFHVTRGPAQPDGHSCGVLALAVLRYWVRHQFMPDSLSLDPRTARDDLRRLLDSSEVRATLGPDSDAGSNSPRSRNQPPDPIPAKRARQWEPVFSESIALLREHTQRTEQLLDQQGQLFGFKPCFEYLAEAQRWQNYIETASQDKTAALAQVQQQHDQSLTDLAEAQSRMDGFRTTDEALTPCHRAFMEQHDARTADERHVPHIDERAKAAYEDQHKMALDWLDSREQILQDGEAEVSKLQGTVTESAARLGELRVEVATVEGDLKRVRREVEWHDARDKARAAAKAYLDLLA